jgi:antitoxin ChpS
MMAVPPAILDQLHLQAGAIVDLVVDGERLIVEAKRKPNYTLDELLAQCIADEPIPEQDRACLDAPPVGRELL